MYAPPGTGDGKAGAPSPSEGSVSPGRTGGKGAIPVSGAPRPRSAYGALSRAQKVPPGRRRRRPRPPAQERSSCRPPRPHVRRASMEACPLVRWRRRRRAALAASHVGAGGQWASGLRRRPGAGGGSAAGRRLRPGCGPCRLHNSFRAPRGPSSRLPATPGCSEPHDGVRCRRLPSEVRFPRLRPAVGQGS